MVELKLVMLKYLNLLVTIVMDCKMHYCNAGVSDFMLIFSAGSCFLLLEGCPRRNLSWLWPVVTH